MCRWLAYKGRPILMEALITTPEHSLIAQSIHAEEAKVTTNGDGFGIGWYGERDVPGLYRELRPAWSDENLRSICSQVRSGLFFAHVRAATGTAIARANCHPFVQGRCMFMHNGQVGGYAKLKRRIEALIPDELYNHRTGTTDSEAVFLAAYARGLEYDTMGALASTLKDISRMMREESIGDPLRFTAAISNGDDLYAIRWSSDARAPTLYHREIGDGTIVVSEPLDANRASWHEVPANCFLVARKGQAVEIVCADEAIRQIAA